MVRLSEKERIEILIMCGYGNMCRSQQEVCDLWNDMYPDRSICQSTVSKIVKKFREVGHVRDAYKGRTAIGDDEQLDLLLTVQENPHISSRQIATENSLSKSTVLRYLKKNKFHPYKINLVHELNEEDFDRRMEFCEVMMERCNNDPQFVEHVAFSDEASFYLNGTVNRQNCRYWSDTNPHWMMEAQTQYPEKVNVWAGIVGNNILGPFFIEGTLTAEQYLEMLQNDIVPAIVALYPDNQNPQIPNNLIWFQQDGAPPHYARIVRDYLDTIFLNRWIGRRGFIEWPPRSPDLAPLDFYFWGYLKSKVYFNRPHNIQDLKDRIRNEVRLIRPETLTRVLEEFRNRLGYCQEVNGMHFEQLI